MKPLIFSEMCIDRKRIKFQVDCGASVNLIPVHHIGDAEVSRPTQGTTDVGQIAKDTLGECRVKMINPANDKKYAVFVCYGNVSPWTATQLERVSLCSHEKGLK